MEHCIRRQQRQQEQRPLPTLINNSSNNRNSSHTQPRPRHHQHMGILNILRMQGLEFKYTGTYQERPAQLHLERPSTRVRIRAGVAMWRLRARRESPAGMPGATISSRAALTASHGRRSKASGPRRLPPPLKLHFIAL
jgi:hypothetical protein